MTLIELVESVAYSSGISKDVVKKVLICALSVIKDTALGADEDVSLRGFGKFSRKTYRPKIAFGKLTREKMTLKFTPNDSVSFYKGGSDG